MKHATIRFMPAVIAGLLALGNASAALAAAPTPSGPAPGTQAGTAVNNSVSVTYSVAGTQQSDHPTASVSFLVDRKVNVTVAALGGTTTVAPGATAQAIAFTVTNNTNDTQDFSLAASNLSGDNFDVTATSFKYYVDTNGDGVYTPGTDTQVTYLDEMKPDEVRTVFVVADIPATGLATGNVANVALEAIAYESVNANGSYKATANTLGAEKSSADADNGTADSATKVDVVLADAAGTASGDAATDGQHSATNSYTVKTAVLTLSKTATVISDPVSGTTNPKAIPGAVVEYCLLVSNASGNADAGPVVLSDDLTNQVTVVAPATAAIATYNTGSIRYGTGTSCAWSSGTTATDTNTDTDSGDVTSNIVHVTTATLTAGSSFWAAFRVTIN